LANWLGNWEIREKGSPAYMSEQQRLATTYHTTIQPTQDDAPIDENIQRKAIEKERETARFARIRDNQARVEASNDVTQTKQITDNNRRVATVKKQQENYAQAIALRQARGGE